MELTYLKVGDKIIIQEYDPLPCMVEKVDIEDKIQPVYVRWEDGTATWPEPKYKFEVIK